ncbi:hypothetical protein FKP32DRAFT_1599332 [Trametes sanguinea]|nr:hypothetical protein FKP32DRAFT_1605147 [Trametes sanguinea]KAI9070395.1 hypothetical protein FKP32DRAFT_1599332 [Trametes sanguinea]
MPAATRVPTHFAVLAMLASADDLATLIEVAIPTATDHAVHTIFLFEELADSGNRDPRDWRDSMDRVISALVAVTWRLGRKSQGKQSRSENSDRTRMTQVKLGVRLG